MTLNIVSSFNGVSDPDAAAYIEAVEAADGELLEFAVGKAINDFVLGCKADGIWDAIKASCILAGARTLNGALVPLAGTAPTNYNFVSGDYDRETGLVGDASTKYLDSNRNSNIDPQNSFHLSAYATHPGTVGYALAQGGTESGVSMLGVGFSVQRNRSSGFTNIAGSSGFNGSNRSSSLSFIHRASGINTPVNIASQAPFNGNILVYARGYTGSPASLGDARLAFYSIGESLDLALLDTRVTDLITAFGAAIP